MSITNKIIWGSLLLSVIFTAGSIHMLATYNITTKYAIENIFTETFGVRLTIGELHINKEQGTMRLSHVLIFNTRKFSDGAAIEIEDVDVTLDSASRGMIRVSDIDVSNMQVNLEVLPAKNNLTAITRRMLSIKPAAVLSDAEKLRIMIDSVEIKGSRVRPRALQQRRASRDIVSVPEIRMSQIGYAENGIPLKQAIRHAWATIIPEFEKTARGAGFFEGMGSETYADILDGPVNSHKGESMIEE